MNTKNAWTTTILIKNVHCASCVAYIKRILNDAYLDDVYNVEVNIVSHEVTVSHDRSISAPDICHSLSDAAFEVHSAATFDQPGVKIDEIGSEDRGSAWVDAATEFWRQSHRTSSSKQHSERNKIPQHLANCDACKEEISSESHYNILHQKLQVRESKDVVSSEPYHEDACEKQDFDSMADIRSPEVEANQLPTNAQREARYEAILSIGGMTCASCTSAINHGLSDLSYVEEVNVTLMTNSARVVFLGEENLQDIVDKVEDLGYDCSVERHNPMIPGKPQAKSNNRTRNITLKLHGMYCKHCPPRLIESIKSIYSGAVTIDQAPTLTEPLLKITYLPSPPQPTIRDIIASISALDDAFSAEIYTPPSIEQRSQEMQRKEQYRLLVRLVASFVFAVPTLLISVVWMSLEPSSNNVRQFFEQHVWAGAVTRADWALFILASPVYFLAADVFHVRAIKEIRALWRRSSKVPIPQRFYRFGSMNLLISAGTSVAYFASIAVLGINATTPPSSNTQSSTYFDSVILLTFFILAGRYLEAYSKAKTGNAVGMLTNLRPRDAILVSSSTEKQPVDSMFDNNEKKEEVSTSIQRSTQKIDTKLLEIGDVVLVPHGSSPPADGIIVEGKTKFNESSLTGEARLISKQPGDAVFTGAINAGDPISVRISDVGGSSMLDQIVAVVRDGQTKRAPVERVVDTLTQYFVPMITALAILTFIIWLTLGYSGALPHVYLGSQQGGWAFWSLEFAIAVFVVACPCGIGLAAPTALFVGSGLAASHGILVRGGGEAFQEASKIDAIIFDKTGTLTEGGDRKVTDHAIILEGDERTLAWSAVKTLEESSTHPLARALLDLATEQSPPQAHSISTSEEPGMGMRGTFTTKDPRSDRVVTYEAALGNEALLSSLTPKITDPNFFTISTLSTWKSQSKSVALLALRDITLSEDQTNSAWYIAAIFAISDPIRPSALHTITTLQQRNIPVYMMTGDNPSTASAVASTLSIPQDHVFAGVLPTGKADKIRWLQDHTPRRQSSSSSWLSHFTPRKFSQRSATIDETKRKSIIAFVGDGINDAPALTTASVSLSLSGASDIAMHSSSFILLSSSLENIITLFALSERVFQRVKFNFGWALVYNIILVPIAAGVLFKVREGGWRLGPVWGSAAMALSSLCVVVSSLALRWESGWGGHWVRNAFRRSESE